MRKVKVNLIRDRREPYRLRIAPRGVLAITAGVDTQDNRLAAQILGWGRGMACWVLDYVELDGDPGEDEVWAKLTDLLNRPIAHEMGGWLNIEATAIDAGGHRTEHVKHFVRSRRVRRPMCIFGAVPNNAPILSRPKLEDVNYKGKLDKKGVQIYHVGTVAAKHWLFQRLATDADKSVEARLVRLSDDLDDFYLDGLVSETYNPRKNRYEKSRGSVRNEPLDTFVYAYAAAHHHDLRLHRASATDWSAREARLAERARQDDTPVSRGTRASAPQDPALPSDSSGTMQSRPADPRPSPLLSTRAALDEILCRLDREPTSPVSPADLAEWKGTRGGTAEEIAMLGALVERLGDPAAPIATLLDSALAQRARELLRGPAPLIPVRRFVRGTRPSGLK